MNSNVILAWSAIIAAVAFAALCVYLINVLKSAKQSLESAQSAVEEVKETIGSLQGEIRRLTHTVNEITTDVQSKLEATNPLFDVVRDVGVMLRDVSGSAREATHSFSRAMRRKASELDSGAAKMGWLRWAALGARVVMGMKKGWQQKQRAQEESAELEMLRRDEETYPSMMDGQPGADRVTFERMNH